MLDITLFRDEKQREKIRESEKNRFKDSTVVDRIFELDKERIACNFNHDKINAEINNIQKRIKDAFVTAKTEKCNCEEIVKKLEEEKIEPKEKQAKLKERATFLKEEIDRLITSVGNILDPEVPVAKDDDGNVTVREYSSGREIKTKDKGYAELMLGFTNPNAGTEAFGHRGYYLEGKMALLARALKNYAIDFLVERGYNFVQTPVMLRKDVMGLTAQLSDFDEQLYKVENDLYLIATSEQPLTALYMNKKLTDEDLPKLLAGESLCFRKEAGAYGKDNAGIFRVHQFDKIEQFVICKPEESVDIHERLIKTSEEFYKSLELSFRVVLIASGEMNDAAAKKYDLEALFPNSGKFRELVSASNCTDYQSRNLNVAYGFPKENERTQYVHMLNATLCAVQRTLCCIVENYQDSGRIIVPEVLRKYTNFDHIDL